MGAFFFVYMKNSANIVVVLVFSALVISCNLSKLTGRGGDSEPTERTTVKGDEDIRIADDEIVFDDSDKFPITKVEYEKIEKGMTYAQVVKLLRREGEMLNSSMVGDYKIETWRWKGDAKFSFIKCTFRNGLLSIKDESNLK